MKRKNTPNYMDKLHI